MKNPNILVIGDYCIEECIRTEPNTFNPLVNQSPIIRALVKEQKKEIGRSAKVIKKLIDLGAIVYASGIIGDDENSSYLINHLNYLGANTSLMMMQNNRITPKYSSVKIGGEKYPEQTAIEIDYENKHSVDDSLIRKLKKELIPIIKKIDSIIIYDSEQGIDSKGIEIGLIDNRILERILLFKGDSELIITGISNKEIKKLRGIDEIVLDYENSLINSKEIQNYDILKSPEKLVLDFNLKSFLVNRENELKILEKKDLDVKIKDIKINYEKSEIKQKKTKLKNEDVIALYSYCSCCNFSLDQKIEFIKEQERL